VTKREEAVLRAARLYGKHGIGKPTERGRRLYKFWEARLLRAAVMLAVEECEAAKRSHAARSMRKLYRLKWRRGDAIKPGKWVSVRVKP